jgi:hypothetical protein
VNPPTFRLLTNCRVVLLGFMGLIALPVDELIAQQPAQQPAAPAEPDSAKPAAATWETRHAGEIAVEAPFPIEDGPDVLPRAPENVRNALVSVKTFRTGGSKQGFQITFTCLTYKAGVPVDIDKAIEALTAKLSALAGDLPHKIPIEPVKVSGLDARHSGFHGTDANAHPFYGSLVVVQQGQKLWEIQALCVNEAAVPDLARIMGSITVEPAP